MRCVCLGYLLSPGFLKGWARRDTYPRPGLLSGSDDDADDDDDTHTHAPVSGLCARGPEQKDSDPVREGGGVRREAGGKGGRVREVVTLKSEPWAFRFTR